MLIQFRVENHRSLRDEQTLSLVASGLDPEDPRLLAVPGLGETLLPVAAIYGANASGKSNLLRALAFMRECVLLSHRYWLPDQGVPREPFAFSFAPEDSVSLFEVNVVLAGIRHCYGFAADDRVVQQEWLYTWPHGRQQTWFVREGQRFEFSKKYLHGKNRDIEDRTRSNSLFLSAAAQENHKQLLPLFRWFSSHLSLAGTPLGWQPDPDRATRLVAPGGKLRTHALALLRSADLGITDVRVEDVPTESWVARSTPRLLFRHEVEGGPPDTWLPLEQESMGTVALVALLPALLDALESGGLLVVDELDASLHPALALEIIRLFQSPSRNPHRAQLIFNTHDTTLLGNLLGDPPLRRDQVWLAEKDRTGSTKVYPLTDFFPRKVENLERGYLQGRYGAVPFLSGFGMDVVAADGEEG